MARKANSVGRDIPSGVVCVAEQAVLNMVLAGWVPPNPGDAADWAAESSRINQDFDRWLRRHARPRHARLGVRAVISRLGP